MKAIAIGKPWRYLLDGTLANTIMYRTFASKGVKNVPMKNYSGNARVRRKILCDVYSSEKHTAHIFSHLSASAARPGTSFRRRLKNCKDEAIADENIGRAENFTPVYRDLSPTQAQQPVQPEACTPEELMKGMAQPDNISSGVTGFSGIMLVAHPLAIVYITSCQRDHQLIYASPKITNLGFTQDAWLGKPDFRLQQVFEEDATRVGQALKHSCDTAEIFSCHYRLYDSAGKVHWFHDEASVVCDAAGVPLFIRGVMLDITDKKAMEAELTQHRYCLESCVEKRTEQLVRRITVLESCNSALCDQLDLHRKNLAAPKQ